MCSSFLRLVYIGGLFLLKFTIFVDYQRFGHFAFAGFSAAKNEIMLVPSFEIEIPGITDCVPVDCTRIQRRTVKRDLGLRQHLVTNL